MKLSFLRSTAVAGVMAVCMTPLALQSAQAAPSTIPYPTNSATNSSSASPDPSTSSSQGSATTTPSSTSSFGEEADGDDTAAASSSPTSPASSPTSPTSTTATSDASASSLPSSSSGADDSQNFLVGVDEAFANTVDATKFDVLLASGTASNDTTTAGDSNSSASNVKNAAKKASTPVAKTAAKATAKPSASATTPAATAVPTITGNSIPISSSVTTTAAAPAPTTTTTIPVSSSGPKTLALTTPALRCEVVSGDSHLAPWVARVRTRITAQFGITDIGGYRNDPGAQDHATGHALDVMLPSIGSPLGDEIATWVLHNYKSLNVKYVIYRQHIWAPYRQYWRQMEDRGDPTQNHFDHVHISFLDGSGSCPTN